MLKQLKKTHTLADHCQKNLKRFEQACNLYEKEAYFWEQHAHHTPLPSKAESLIKGAQSYAKASHAIVGIDPQKAIMLSQHASQATLESLKYLVEISKIHDCPEVYEIYKDAASLIVLSDKAKAAELCEKIACLISDSTFFINFVNAALSYNIAGELIKETDPFKASILFQKADDQELALMKLIMDEDKNRCTGTKEDDAQEVSDAYKDAALCLEFYDKGKAQMFHAKAEEFQKMSGNTVEE